MGPPTATAPPEHDFCSYPEPATACSLKRSTWLLQRDSVFHNSLKICENYGPNLDTCPEGTVLGLLVDSSSCLHLYVNGMDQGVAAQDILNPCYVLIDLYGQCEQVTIVTNDTPAVGAEGADPHNQGDMEKADMVDGIKESVCWTPPVDLNTMKTCEYHALCARFKDLLLLPDDYFVEDPKFSLCYCESCHKLRGDEAYYKRGLHRPALGDLFYVQQVTNKFDTVVRRTREFTPT